MDTARLPSNNADNMGVVATKIWEQEAKQEAVKGGRIPPERSAAILQSPSYKQPARILSQRCRLPPRSTKLRADSK